MYKICNLTPIWSFASTTRTGGSAAGGVSGAGRRSSSTTRPPASPVTGAGGLTATRQVGHPGDGAGASVYCCILQTARKFR